MSVSYNTTNEQSSHDSLGKITWASLIRISDPGLNLNFSYQESIFHPSVSQKSVSDVPESFFTSQNHRIVVVCVVVQSLLS